MVEGSTIWTEKYRPKKFAEIKGQEAIVARLEAFVKQKNLPHLLFAGPAGVGKSTISVIIARTLFGDSYRDNFLELNASDERGIDVVRNKVKDFARTKAIGNVPFKIIFLDECDALTKDAQQALRRTMENYSGTCRFVLAANYSSKIIDPIQSRCAVFRFKRLAKEQVLELINQIVASEGLKIEQEAREALATIAEGDCRRATNILQSCATIEKNITPESVYSLASVAEPKEIKEVLLTALKGEFIKFFCSASTISPTDNFSQPPIISTKNSLPLGNLSIALPSIKSLTSQEIKGVRLNFSSSRSRFSTLSRKKRFSSSRPLTLV